MRGWCFREAHEGGTWLDMGNDLHPSTEKYRLSNGREVLDPATTRIAPEQMHVPVNLKSSAQSPHRVSVMTRVGFEPTTYGLKVPFTTRTASAEHTPTEYDATTYLSAYDPKRPARDASSCQFHVRKSDSHKADVVSPVSTNPAARLSVEEKV